MGTPLFLNEKTWKYDVAQDSNQFDSAYSKIREGKVRRPKNQKKQFEVIQIKLNEKYNIPKNPNNNLNVNYKGYENKASPVITESDFNDDIDEFNELSLEKDKNKIASIDMKYNDINMIDNKNKGGMGQGQYSYKKQLCITEPDNFIDPINHNKHIHGMHNRNLSSSILPNNGNRFFTNNVNLNFTNLTPNKNKVMPFAGGFNLTPRNLNFPQNNFGIINNNLIYNNAQISHPNNFANMMMYKNNTGSFISQSNYSSSNQMREQGCYEHEVSTEVGDYSHEE